MADVKAGGAFVELSLRIEGFKKGIQLAERKLAALATSIRNIGAGLVAAGGSAATAFVPAIKAASQYQEQISKFRVLFDELSSQTEEFSKDFAKQVGRSRLELVKFLAEAQGLFIPIGFDRSSAAELSKTMTKLAIDLASFNNVADADAFRALFSGLTGEIEPLRKFGVFLNDARISQELFNRSIDPEKASTQEKTLARLAIILRDTASAQNDATRTSGSFENQLKRLQSEVSNLAVTSGNLLLPTVTKYVKLLSEAVITTSQYADRNSQLVSGLASSAAWITAAGAALLGLSAAISAAAFATNTLSAALATLTGVVGTISSPVVVAIAVVVGLAATLDGVRAKFGSFGETVSTALKTIVIAVGNGDVVRAFGVMWSAVDALATDALAGIGQTAAKFLLDIAESLANFADQNGLIAAPLKAIATPFALLSGTMQNSINALTLRAEEARRKMREYAETIANAAESTDDLSNASQSVNLPTSSSGLSMEEAKQQAKDENRIQEEAKRLFKETRTESELYAIQLRELRDLHEQGAISNEVYMRAVKNLRAELNSAKDAEQVRLDTQRDGQRIFDETRTALEKYNAEVNRLIELQKSGFISVDTLHRALDQSRKSFEQSDEAFQKQNDTVERGKRLFEETKTAVEKYADAIKDIEGLRNAGAITQQTFERARDKAKKELDAATNETTSRIPSVLSSFGGARAGQIFGASDAISKQQLSKLAVIADESKRTRQALERNALAFE